MAVRGSPPAQLLFPKANTTRFCRPHHPSLRLSSRLWGQQVEFPTWPPRIPPSQGSCRRCTVRAARQKLWKNRKPEVSQDVVNRVLEALQHEGANVQEVLERKGAFLKPNDWFLVLEGVGKAHRWLLALEIFRWMQLQKWYKPDNGFYSKMISIMGKERQLRLATWLFAEMKRKGLRPNTSMYNAMIAAQVTMSDIPGSLEKALSLFEEMKGKKQKYAQPSIVTYNTLIKAFALAGDFDKVKSLFEELQSAELSPDVYTFNVIIGACGKEGHIDRMEEMHSLMMAMKCTPDSVTLNSLIHAYGKAGDLRKAEDLLQRMIKSKKTPAEVKTFNSLIHAYGQFGLLEKMEAVAERLIDAGYTPTAITFEIMIMAYGRAGSFDSMKECVKAMKVAKLKPSYSTCKFMLEALCEARLFNCAVEILTDALLSGLASEETLCNVILKAYALEGRSADIESLLCKMEKIGILVDRVVLLDLLDTYAKEESRPGPQDRLPTITLENAGEGAVGDQHGSSEWTGGPE